MAKLTEIEKSVKNYIPVKLDYAYQKSVSFSQYSTYKTCPFKWYLSHVENKPHYSPSIHTVFGTAIHETLQHYISVMYDKSGVEADKINLIELFQTKLSEEYQKEYKTMQVHFSSAIELREFYEDGVAILTFIKKNRNKLFTIRKVKLLGIEIPLLLKLKNNLYFKGYIDFALLDEDLGKITIYDIKTSTNSWGDKQKKDETKISQIILYKEFFAKQYGFEIDKIDVEFFIVKRKIWEESEFPIPRTQSFKPASGKGKRNAAVGGFEQFIQECFDGDGKYITTRTYPKVVGESSCKWCIFADKPELCNKQN